MKIIIQKMGSAIFWLIAGFICCVICAVLAAIVPTENFYISLAGAGGFICLGTSFMCIREASKGAIQINEVDERIYKQSGKSFDKVEDLQDWFFNIFEDLKEIPSERLLHLHQIGNTSPEADLKSLILWCSNTEPKLLSSDELNILRKCLVQRFPIRTDQILDDENLCNPKFDAAVYVTRDKIVEYYQLTGKFANTPDLAYGLLRSLSAKNFMETNRMQLCITLEGILTQQESIKPETTHELYVELIKQNANKTF